MKKGKVELDFTQVQLVREIDRIEHRRRYRFALRRTVMWLLTIAAAAVLIATLWLPVFRVTGDSMEPLLQSGQVVLGYRTQNLERGDLAAFYYENQILLKHVIAKAGDWIEVDDQGWVLVNGEGLQEDFVLTGILDADRVTYPYQVPEGCCFVIGEPAGTSTDSGSAAVGLVAKEKIAAKIICSIWPLKRLEYFG